MTDTTAAATSAENEPHTVTDWKDLGQEMWNYLTSRGATIDYRLIDMVVEVPRDIGPDAPRAVWRFDGTVRITTNDKQGTGSAPVS